MLRAALLVVSCALLVTAACNRPSKELCTEACWNHYELKYPAKIEEEVAALPEAEREARRAEMLEELATKQADPDHGPFQACLESCTKRGVEETVRCWAEAEDVEALEACED